MTRDSARYIVQQWRALRTLCRYYGWNIEKVLGKGTRRYRENMAVVTEAFQVVKTSNQPNQLPSD